MNSYAYNMPVVSQELPPAESLHQLFDSLKYLDDCVTDVFSRIQSRINVERSKIQSVVSRIDHCQQQVVKIQQNATKATTVHSIAKYPAAAQLPAYPRLADELSSTHHPAPASHTLTKEERLAKAERVDTSALFTALSDASRAESRTINRANMQQEGLGRLPSHLPSISSILLFNTVDNPYKKYESLDNLQGVAGKDRERVTAEVAAAPQTMIDGDMLPMFSGPDYAFRPKMSDVPTFALPTMLPDLPGVADISWSMDGNKQSIAPSQAPISSFNANALQYVSAPSAAPMKALPAPAGYTAPAPGPPAPAAPAVRAPAATPAPSGPPTAPPVAAAAPPPPPAAPKPPVSSGDDGGRSALLDAIRNPGMRLRKVTESVDKDAPPPVPKPKAGAAAADSEGGDAPAAGQGKKQASAPPPMDMMSALAAKLKMRAKAMTGKVDDEDSKPAIKNEKPAAPALKPPSAPVAPPVAPAKPTMMDNAKMANVDAYLAHKTAAAAKKDEDDDWED